jgi:hypothetical protein
MMQAHGTLSGTDAVAKADDGETARSERVGRIVRRVCAHALTESGARGIVVLEDWTPEGELAYEWLVGELDETRVWRAAGAAGNMPAECRAPGEPDGAAAGRPAPRPTCCRWATSGRARSRLTGRWSAPAGRRGAGGRGRHRSALDEALGRLVDAGRWRAGRGRDCRKTLRRSLALYDRGRTPAAARVVPKLSAERWASTCSTDAGEEPVH